MHWFNEPPAWSAVDDRLTVTAGPHTDLWRTTHYGFIRDNAHGYLQPVSGDFTAEVQISGQYAAQYDQAGLLVRLDERRWLKCGIEFVDGVQQISAVITREFSDWSVAPLPDNPPAIWLRVTRTGPDVEVFYARDGVSFTLLRLARFTDEDVQVGPMCAAPDGPGFEVSFAHFRVGAPD
jgi:hypothetical protein